MFRRVESNRVQKPNKIVILQNYIDFSMAGVQFSLRYTVNVIKKGSNNTWRKKRNTILNLNLSPTSQISDTSFPFSCSLLSRYCKHWLRYVENRLIQYAHREIFASFQSRSYRIENFACASAFAAITSKILATAFAFAAIASRISRAHSLSQLSHREFYMRILFRSYHIKKITCTFSFAAIA